MSLTYPLVIPVPGQIAFSAVIVSNLLIAPSCEKTERQGNEENQAHTLISRNIINGSLDSAGSSTLLTTHMCAGRGIRNRQTGPPASLKHSTREYCFLMSQRLGEAMLVNGLVLIIVLFYST